MEWNLNIILYIFSSNLTSFQKIVLMRIQLHITITSTNEAFIRKHLYFALLTALWVSSSCEITFTEVICWDYLYFTESDGTALFFGPDVLGPLLNCHPYRHFFPKSCPLLLLSTWQLVPLPAWLTLKPEIKSSTPMGRVWSDAYMTNQL